MLNHPHRRKTATGKVTRNKDELIRRIDEKLRGLKLHFGDGEWDPVVLCAIIAAEAYAEDDKGLALQAAKEVAQYCRPKLAQVQVTGEDEVPEEVRRAQLTEKRRLLTEKLRIPIPPSLAREIAEIDAAELGRDTASDEIDSTSHIH